MQKIQFDFCQGEAAANARCAASYCALKLSTSRLERGAHTAPLVASVAQSMKDDRQSAAIFTAAG